MDLQQQIKLNKLWSDLEISNDTADTLHVTAERMIETKPTVDKDFGPITLKEGTELQYATLINISLPRPHSDINTATAHLPGAQDFYQAFDREKIIDVLNSIGEDFDLPENEQEAIRTVITNLDTLHL